MIIGPDGVGKTSLARQLIADHGPPTLYIHFRPRFRIRPPERPRVEGVPPPKRMDPGPRPLGWVRLARSVLLFWGGYLRWVRPAVRNGALVVGDRWVYGYVGQPGALGFGGPSWLAQLATRITPGPDLLVRLRAPADVIALRKGDLRASEIAREDQTWDTLSVAAWPVDASADPSQISAAVASKLAEGNESRSSAPV